MSKYDWNGEVRKASSMREFVSGEGLLVVLAVVAVPLLVWAMVKADQAEQQRCAGAGGHIISKSTTGVGPAIGGQGGVAITSGSVNFCVSDDGRILF